MIIEERIFNSIKELNNFIAEEKGDNFVELKIINIELIFHYEDVLKYHLFYYLEFL